MLKKRLIFTLLYTDGSFILSRNFRRQKVGGLDWLKQNYDFKNVSRFIDELIILNIGNTKNDLSDFAEVVSEISRECFVPVAAGGGIKSLNDAKLLISNGADKVVLNTLIFENEQIVKEISSYFGKQCVVGSIDVKRNTLGIPEIYYNNGSILSSIPYSKLLPRISESLVGEIYLNSIDKDGTGQGYDMKLLNDISSVLSVPVIMAGGVGNAKHLLTGLRSDAVSAVATAHLFNFVGSGLKEARKKLHSASINLAFWEAYE